MTAFDEPPDFEGFPRQTFAWFAGIEADNSKAYFTAHRATFDEYVRGAFEGMLDELAGELGGEVKIFRQNRDIRFSRDKSPYKTETYGIIGHRPNGQCAMYARISADGLFAGSGYYRMERDQLTRFRDAILDDRRGPGLDAALQHARDAGLETYGETLKTAPRGYPRDHPRIALLRHTSAIAGRGLAPRRGRIDRDGALAYARSTWAACAPLGAWLVAQVGPSVPGTQ